MDKIVIGYTSNRINYDAALKIELNAETVLFDTDLDVVSIENDVIFIRELLKGVSDKLNNPIEEIDTSDIISILKDLILKEDLDFDVDVFQFQKPLSLVEKTKLINLFQEIQAALDREEKLENHQKFLRIFNSKILEKKRL